MATRAPSELKMDVQRMWVRSLVSSASAQASISIKNQGSHLAGLLILQPEDMLVKGIFPQCWIVMVCVIARSGQ